jgi:hypothetical protein
LIITVDSTERPDIYEATIQKTNLNGKFKIYDKVYIVKGSPAERFTQMRFYNKEQSTKYWIVSEDVIFLSVEDIINAAEKEVTTEKTEISKIAPGKFVLPEASQDTSENKIYINTPFDYCNDYDGDEFTSDIDFIVKTIIDLYSEDPYRVKEGIKEIYAIIKCRKKARELAVNEAEYNALDQAMNFMYLTHFHQRKKREQALNIVTAEYKVSRAKIESIWGSLVNYKSHFGKAIQFERKKYTRKKT